MSEYSFDGSEDQESEDCQLVNYAPDVLTELVDDVILGLCFDVHRSCKMGTFFVDDVDPAELKEFEIVDQVGLDIFGQPVSSKKQYECECPNCGRTISANRFAPHLEKCMGMGRNSSRIASKRLQNSGKCESEGDDDDDNDWTYGEKKKKKKSDKKANSPRQSKPSKSSKNGDISSVSSVGSEKSSGGYVNYEAMTIEERKAVLKQICGVISEHTKRMCTRSHRCPQHSDEQRRQVRLYLLGNAASSLLDDDIHVDIDGYEDSPAVSAPSSHHPNLPKRDHLGRFMSAQQVAALAAGLPWEAVSNSPGGSVSSMRVVQQWETMGITTTGPASNSNASASASACASASASAGASGSASASASAPSKKKKSKKKEGHTHKKSKSKNPVLQQYDLH
ncbi:ATXN7L3 [Branchiostoma lanceolatum]|uniref:SAGA-associated factor 11 homolog n=1 Tax=Branchiostoma lanceolatum TaxID=7740 RepID=A0A8K0E6G4_BRALA|nr:ATXN7L3 [Branchiostoma lanceolatum]